MKAQCCPVCHGRGLVPQGFYKTSEYFTSSSTEDEKCRSCHGTGIVNLPTIQA